MILQKLNKQGVLNIPKFLLTNTQYLTIMGSHAYGCNKPYSDYDVYGFAIRPLNDIFPHLKGEIPGFGRQKKNFEQYNQTAIVDKNDGQEYDFTIYSMVKYFSLLMECNPNIIESLYTPLNCIIHSTAIGNKVRDNRHIFLHKGLFHRFQGYAMSQLHKMKTKNPEKGSKRSKDIEEHGYDTKYLYNLVRMLNECEQLLATGDMDLQRDREVYKAIRRGDWTEEQGYKYFEDGDKRLKELYNNSELPYSPDEGRIKALLLECIEMHYDNISSVVQTEDKYISALRQISEICYNLKL